MFWRTATIERDSEATSRSTATRCWANRALISAWSGRAAAIQPDAHDLHETPDIHDGQACPGSFDQARTAAYRAWAAVITGLAFGARKAGAFMSRDPRFGMEALEFRGVVYTNRARLRSVFDPDFGNSVFNIPLAERRRRPLAQVAQVGA